MVDRENDNSAHITEQALRIDRLISETNAERTTLHLVTNL